MEQDWILDVLADIRSFAVKNRMPQLAEQLDDAMLVAAAEMAASVDPAGEEQRLASVANAEQVGSVHRSAATSKNA